jgi:hypothetical protein
VGGFESGYGDFEGVSEGFVRFESCCGRGSFGFGQVLAIEIDLNYIGRMSLNFPIIVYDKIAKLVGGILFSAIMLGFVIFLLLGFGFYLSRKFER